MITPERKQEIKEQIAKLDASLTGQLSVDAPIWDKIYTLKNELENKTPQPPTNSDFECVGCGA